MQQTDNVFSYIYARKTPTITYKRKQQTYGDAFFRPFTPVTSTAASPPFVNTLQSTQQHTSPTDLTPVSTDDEKENTDIQHIDHQQPTFPTVDLDFAPTSAKDIFDLSDDDNNDTQVEIRVASSLHSNNKVKNKPANKKLPKTSKPSACVQQKKNIKQTSTKPSFARALSAPSPVTTTAQPVAPLPIARNTSMLPRLPDTKRRKRNLVSQLKAANGERPDFSTQHGGNRFYDTSSDNDDDVDPDTVSTFDSFNDHVPAERPHNLACRPILTPSASSPTTSQILSMESNDYNDRMEQELADLMRTEFGQVDDFPSTISSSSSSERGRYVPENTIRAPVTYKRLNNKSTTSISSNEPRTGLDQEMEQQIQHILSSDF